MSREEEEEKDHYDNVRRKIIRILVGPRRSADDLRLLKSLLANYSHLVDMHPYDGDEEHLMLFALRECTGSAIARDMIFAVYDAMFRWPEYKSPLHTILLPNINTVTWPWKCCSLCVMITRIW